MFETFLKSEIDCLRLMQIRNGIMRGIYIYGQVTISKFDKINYPLEFGRKFDEISIIFKQEKIEKILRRYKCC